MATVILGCKTPNGFIMEHEGVSIKINGTQSEDGVVMVERGLTIGVTDNVPKDLWDAWRAKFADHPLVAGSKPYNEPFVFEVKSEASAKARAKETKEVKTGLEQKTPQELEKISGAKKDDDKA